jgi:hypothetical protein
VKPTRVQTVACAVKCNDRSALCRRLTNCWGTAVGGTFLGTDSASFARTDQKMDHTREKATVCLTGLSAAREIEAFRVKSSTSPAQLPSQSLPVPPIDDQLAAMPANSVDRTPSMEASRRPTSAEIY